MNARKNVTLVTPTQTPKFEVDGNTIVTIDLSGGEGKNRVAVHEVLTFKELGIDPTKLNVLDPPAFPNDEIAAVSQNAALDGPTRAQRVKELIAEYTRASADFSKNNQGMEVQDLINVAVMNYLVDKQGFTRKDTRNKPYVNANELLVNSFVHNGGVIFKVTGTAIWGR
jgi:hypothetical protein